MTTSIEFNDVMFMALDHGISSIKENAGPLIPFIFYQNRKGEKELHRVVSEKLEQGLEESKNYVMSTNLDINIYAIVWDGYVTVENKKWDAILVEAGSRNREEGFLLAQRYEARGLLNKKNHPIGNPIQVDTPKSLIFHQ
ncbi:hypothetical protein ACFLUZ_03880 [Chloroflexota bacterium]